jgi:hypothetical protein
MPKHKVKQEVTEPKEKVMDVSEWIQKYAVNSPELLSFLTEFQKLSPERELNVSSREAVIGCLIRDNIMVMLSLSPTPLSSIRPTE